MITAQTVFEGQIFGGFFFIGCGIALEISRLISKRKNGRLLNIVIMAFSIPMFYIAYGLRDNSEEVLATTTGVYSGYRRTSLGFEYVYHGELINGSCPVPNDTPKIILKGGKYKAHVFKAGFYHASWIDFSKPAE